MYVCVFSALVNTCVSMCMLFHAYIQTHKLHACIEVYMCTYKYIYTNRCVQGVSGVTYKKKFDKEARENLLDVFRDAADFWGEKKIPFRVFFSFQ